MIRLYQFPSALGVPNASPFCLKLETYFLMAGIEYMTIPTDFRGSPKGKLPWIEDSDGTALADSGQIITHLEQTRGELLDGWLDRRQRAQAHLVRRTVEESLYWALLYSRWKTQAGWATTKPAFFGSMPMPLRLIIPSIVRRKTVRDLRGQGYGLHSFDDVLALAREDMEALNETLGSGPYFFGNRPASADAAVFGLLANLIHTPIENPLENMAREYPAFRAYCSRIMEKWFPGKI